MGNAMDFTNFKRELQTLNYAELNYLISDIMLEIKKRSYNEGMVKGMTSGSAEAVAPVESQKSPQQLRDEIIEKAKWDVADLSDIYKFNFVFNSEKRTVVAIWLTKNTNEKGKHVVITRGIAKCDPSDCFNVHIGKAVALRRALGLEVPTEYLNAPQPTEVRVGDVVEFRWLDRDNPDVEISKVIAIEDDKVWYDDGDFDYLTSINKIDPDSHSIMVTDDSREGVTE